MLFLVFNTVHLSEHEYMLCTCRRISVLSCKELILNSLNKRHGSTYRSICVSSKFLFLKYCLFFIDDMFDD